MIKENFSNELLESPEFFFYKSFLPNNLSITYNKKSKAKNMSLV